MEEKRGACRELQTSSTGLGFRGRIELVSAVGCEGVGCGMCVGSECIGMDLDGGGGNDKQKISNE